MSARAQQPAVGIMDGASLRSATIQSTLPFPGGSSFSWSRYRSWMALKSHLCTLLLACSVSVRRQPVLLRNSLFSLLTLRRMQAGSLCSRPPSHASLKDKHPLSNTSILLLQTDLGRHQPLLPSPSPCPPPPAASLLVPFIHTCAQIPISLSCSRELC